MISENHVKLKSFCHGFTLLEIILVLILMGILAVAGVQSIATAVKGYTLSKESDEIAQKARMALNRMTLELAFLSGTPTTCTGSNIAFTANYGGATEQHSLYASGTNLYFTVNGSPYLLTNELSSANGLTFTYFNAYNSSLNTSCSANTNMVGIQMNMSGTDWGANVVKSFNTRVALKKFQ